MAPKKFIFNEAKGQFEPARSSFWKILGRLSLLSLSSLLFAVFIGWQFYRWVEPKEQRMLRLDNKQLKENYPELVAQLKEQEKYLKALENRDMNFYRAIFESEPHFQSEDRFKKLDLMLEASGPRFIHTIANDYAYILDTLTRHFRQSMQSYQPPDTSLLRQQLDHIPAIEPLIGQIISSGYGYRIHPIYKIRKFNYGVDYQCKAGTPVLATAAGQVVYAGSKGGHGLTLIIKHRNGLETWYTHLKKMLVNRGEKVDRAQVIGSVGNTGVSISPHLHYEVHVDGQAVNPVSFFFAHYKPQDLLRLARKSSRMGQSL